VLFAVNEAHVLPVAWISNRNALVATVPMLFGLCAWIRWVEDGWRAGRILAPLGIVIGMAGSELGLAVLSYFVAYALLGARAIGVRARLTRLAPFAGLGLAYVLTYRLLGFDGSGSGAYQEPVQDPVGFLGGVVTAVPTLLASGIAGFSADFWFVAASLRPAQVVAGGMATLGFIAVLRAIWTHLDDSIRLGLRWLLTGSALSFIPVSAVFPSDRMLLVPGIGLSAALAAVLVHAYRSWRTRRRRWLVVVGGYLAVVHLLLAPVLTVYIQTVMIKNSRQSLDLAASPVVVEAGGKEAILIFAPDHVVSLYMPQIIGHLEGPAPRSWRPLSIAPYDHWLRRTGPRTLELEVVDGGVLLRSVFEEVYREPTSQLTPGTIVDRGLLRAEILDANRRGPTRVAFHFDRDLSDPTLYFLVWDDGGLLRTDPPAVGKEVLLKRSLGPGGF
jgi:hypothetical protein